MRRNQKAMNVKNKNVGFTLVELIAVVAIISMIAVYITIEINRSSDDAKIGIATAFLTSNVPAAISSYRARNMGSCRNIAENAAANETLIEGASFGEAGASALKRRLVSRGLTAVTPWDDSWSVAYDRDANRQITITYPIHSNDAGAIGATLAANLTGKPQVDNASYANGVLTVTYSCS